MEVRAFQPADLAALPLQAMQIDARRDLSNPEYGEALAKHAAFTATRKGEVIACIGVIWQWPTYGRAWALLSHDAGPCMMALTRGVRRWLRFHNPGRIDAAVNCEFPAGIRWAELIGMEREGIMRRYTPEGRDVFLYAQVV